MFFCSPFMSLINRENLCVNREKSGPKIRHFFTVSFSPFTSSWVAEGHKHTIDTETKAKRNNMISELITFRITKAKAKWNFGVKCLCKY